MKIQKIGTPEIIMSAPGQKRGYFGWPTVCRTKNGRIAAACSGFRLEHVCPFGKAVIVFSDDEGKSFSAPVPVIDTVLDDRDAGLCPFGESGLILTSFNNTVQFQRGSCVKLQECYDYLDTVDPEEEAKALGSEFRISLDNGESWGEIYHSPITSPHGPVELKDGRILWIGTVFSTEERTDTDIRLIQVYEIKEGGKTEKLGEVPDIYEGGKKLYSCEPYMAEAENGKLICHIRVQGEDFFSTYQTESADGGKTWSTPHALLGKRGGAPAHILKTSSGTLVSAYGYREKPYGIRLMISEDNGESWQKDVILYEQLITDDLGYPATVELADGSFLTVFYAHESSEDEPAVIMAQKWKFI